MKAKVAKQNGVARHVADSDTCWDNGGGYGSGFN
jgi:hypothetical protein